ncbi:MAG: serine hydrolase [Patescibacteria group bacterium]
MPKQITTLVFSMLTAMATGGFIAFCAIFAFTLFTRSSVFATQALEVDTEMTASLHADDIDTHVLEEGEEDPTFVSRFSRVFIYSADDGREIIESAKNSLPTTGKVTVSAPSYVVIDLDRDAVVLEKDADRLLPIASVTKLVTAVVARKILNENSYITLDSKMLAAYGNEGRLRVGEKLRASELLYPLLMVSSNDASEALAQSYGEYPVGRQSFLKEMNEWVNSIGAYRTYFADPSGLSPKNVSTARDLSVIINWIQENDPDILDITLLKSKTVRTHTWTNPTHFLNLASYAGGKNGYTPEADRTSISLFNLGKQQRLYAVVILGSATRDNDILDLLDEALR